MWCDCLADTAVSRTIVSSAQVSGVPAYAAISCRVQRSLWRDLTEMIKEEEREQPPASPRQHHVTWLCCCRGLESPGLRECEILAQCAQLRQRGAFELEWDVGLEERARYWPLRTGPAFQPGYYRVFYCQFYCAFVGLKRGVILRAHREGAPKLIYDAVLLAGCGRLTEIGLLSCGVDAVPTKRIDQNSLKTEQGQKKWCLTPCIPATPFFRRLPSRRRQRIRALRTRTNHLFNSFCPQAIGLLNKDPWESKQPLHKLRILMDCFALYTLYSCLHNLFAHMFASSLHIFFMP